MVLMVGRGRSFVRRRWRWCRLLLHDLPGRRGWGGWRRRRAGGLASASLRGARLNIASLPSASRCSASLGRSGLRIGGGGCRRASLRRLPIQLRLAARHLSLGFGIGDVAVHLNSSQHLLGGEDAIQLVVGVEAGQRLELPRQNAESAHFKE